jgi:hypothetical protein
MRDHDYRDRGGDRRRERGEDRPGGERISHSPKIAVAPGGYGSLRAAVSPLRSWAPYSTARNDCFSERVVARTAVGS